MYDGARRAASAGHDRLMLAELEILKELEPTGVAVQQTRLRALVNACVKKRMNCAMAIIDTFQVRTKTTIKKVFLNACAYMCGILLFCSRRACVR